MVLLVTPGDPAGIGPEITIRALKKAPKNVSLVCIGSAKPFIKKNAKLLILPPQTSLRKLPKKSVGEIYFIPAPETPGRSKRDQLSLDGFQVGWSIERAVALLLAGEADGVVTGPINKSKLNLGGYPFPGHTEMLAELCSGNRGRPLPVTMMLANDRLRVSLVTTHVSISQLPAALSAREISRAIHQTVSFLRDSAGIVRPRVAVCGLNPHAGEGGLFGTEENRVIAPTVLRLQKKLGRLATLVGPVPSDTLFATHLNAPASQRYDAVVCMYHDQGLIPVKLLDFYGTVNISLGLPILRTSVDHGVAYDLVGTNRARADSMIAAIWQAAKLAKTKSTTRRTKR